MSGPVLPAIINSSAYTYHSIQGAHIRQVGRFTTISSPRLEKQR